MNIASPCVCKLMSQLGWYKVVTKVARFASSQSLDFYDLRHAHLKLFASFG